MYRRGVFHVVAFLLVALVGSALAQGGTQLLATSPGPHAIGGGTNTRHQLLITGTYAPAGGGINTLMHLDGTLSPLNPGVDGAGFHVGTPTLTKANSGTHNTFAGLYVDPLVVGAGAAALTNAASAYISGAPSGATNNYALWVGRGQTRFGGDVQVDGNIAAKYQDVAEWVPSAHALSAATVASIDSRVSNRVVMSDKPYDTHVAGVVSTQPGVLLGEAGADKTKLAHSGRVKVKVDARYGAIAIGDLLVTSGTPGHAMRSEPMKIGSAEIHRPGTIIGKALESLQTGQGEILVLLTLQ